MGLHGLRGRVMISTFIRLGKNSLWKGEDMWWAVKKKFCSHLTWHCEKWKLHRLCVCVCVCVWVSICACADYDVSSMKWNFHFTVHKSDVCVFECGNVIWSSTVIVAIDLNQCFSTFALKCNPLQQIRLIAEPMGIPGICRGGHESRLKAESEEGVLGEGQWAPSPPLAESCGAP